MADKDLSESYSPQGKQLPFKTVLDYTLQYLQGSTSGLVGKQSPAAVDRRTGTPIYKIDPSVMAKLVKEHSDKTGYGGWYYPSTSWRPDFVAVNPYNLNMNDPEDIQRAIDHEMFHRHQHAKPEIVNNIVSGLADIGGKPFQRYDDIRVGLTSVSPGYDPASADKEAQAMIISNTLPNFYKGREHQIPTTTPVPTFFDRDKGPQPKVTDPDVIADLQRKMYGTLPRSVQRRYESRLIPIKGETKDEGVPEQGYIQNALDKFMSIIGLGSK